MVKGHSNQQEQHRIARQRERKGLSLTDKMLNLRLALTLCCGSSTDLAILARKQCHAIHLGRCWCCSSAVSWAHLRWGIPQRVRIRWACCSPTFPTRGRWKAATQLESWQKLEPPVRVLPISPLMVLAIGGACLHLGHVAFSLALTRFLDQVNCISSRSMTSPGPVAKQWCRCEIQKPAKGKAHKKWWFVRTLSPTSGSHTLCKGNHLMIFFLMWHCDTQGTALPLLRHPCSSWNTRSFLHVKLTAWWRHMELCYVSKHGTHTSSWSLGFHQYSKNISPRCRSYFGPLERDCGPKILHEVSCFFFAADASEENVERWVVCSCIWEAFQSFPCSVTWRVSGDTGAFVDKLGVGQDWNLNLSDVVVQEIPVFVIGQSHH